MSTGGVRAATGGGSVRDAGVSEAAAAMRRDRTTLTLVVLGFGLLFTVIAGAQSLAFFGLQEGRGIEDPDFLPTLAARVVANAAAVGALFLCCRALRLEGRGRRGYALWGAVAALAAGLVRTAVQLVLGVYEAGQARAVVVDLLIAVAVTAMIVALSAVFVASQRRHRAQALTAAHQRERASEALAALQAEELRVRRAVAEGLHGSVQNRLVLLEAKLARVAERLEGTADAATVRALRSVEAELDTLREADVRQLSRLLYPSGIDLGLAQAARMMMGRVPSGIATRTVIEEAVLAADDPEHPGLSVAQRLLFVRVLEEAVSNALRHGRASALTLRMEAPAGTIRLVFDDDGDGLPEPAPGLGGLALLHERFAAVGGAVVLGPAPSGGARVVATLPVSPH